MAKKIVNYVKLQIAAGAASPAPPVGPALGQHGLNIMGFCKEFNAKTQEMEKGLPVPVIITVYADKSFSFETKTTPASTLLMKELGLKKGSSVPNKDKVGKATRQQLEKIAEIKMPDLSANDMDAAVKIIAGTARSMGIDVDTSEGAS